MYSYIKKLIYSPTTGIPIILTIFPSSYFLTLLFDRFIENTLIFIFKYSISMILTLAILEFFFITFYYYFHKKLFVKTKKISFDKIPYKGHPYIPYVLKEHVKGLPPTVASYPLHYGKYKFHHVSTNNLGFCNGLDGSRNVNSSKPKDLIRVNCIGASTTQNYLVYDNKVYSYPLELEKMLTTQDNEKKFEVNNFGQGGYNTADILVRFLLQILDTKPDVIVLYHGYSDIRSYLSKNFKSDYSHSRYNLSEKLGQVETALRIPVLPLSFLNFLFDKWFSTNLRNSLVEMIHKQDIDLNIDPGPGLKVYERNIQYIVDICKSRNIKIILSTYCHILYKGVEKKLLSLKFDEIVKKENEIIKKIAEKNKVSVIDNANLIPKDEKYFVDSIHFSHEGMQLLSSNFAKEIKKICITH